MKKAFIVLLMFLFTLAVGAQATAKPGFRAGANFSKFSHTDFDFKTDFYVGGFIALKLTDFYSMQPEITYSRQGAIADLRYYDDNTGTITRFEQDIKLEYLSLAFVNRFNFYNLDMHVGPTFDIELQSNVPTNIELDLGVTMGVGYTLPFGLTIEARWKRGLLDVLESDDYNDSLNFVEDNNANNVFQLGLAYSFNAKGASK